MDYRIIGVVNKFFRIVPDMPKFRKHLVERFMAQLSMAHDEAEELIASLIEAHFIHAITVWYYSTDTDSLHSQPGLAMGPKIETEIISLNNNQMS